MADAVWLHGITVFKISFGENTDSNQKFFKQSAQPFGMDHSGQFEWVNSVVRHSDTDSALNPQKFQFPRNHFPDFDKLFREIPS